MGTTSEEDARAAWEAGDEAGDPGSDGRTVTALANTEVLREDFNRSEKVPLRKAESGGLWILVASTFSKGTANQAGK